MAVVARGGMVGRLVASRQLGSWLVNQRYPPTAALSNTCVCFKEASSSNRLEDPRPAQAFQVKIGTSGTIRSFLVAVVLCICLKPGSPGPRLKFKIKWKFGGHIFGHIF